MKLMRRLLRGPALAALVTVAGAGACGGGHSAATSAPAPAASTDAPGTLHKKVALHFSLAPASPADGEADGGSPMGVTVVETNEVGDSRTIDLARLDGPCEQTVADTDRTPSAAHEVTLLRVTCRGGQGARLEVVYLRGQLIVLHAPGATGDRLDFDEIKRLDLPAGAAVTAD